MPVSFEQTFEKLFPWWTGSESQFLSIMDMLNKLNGENDWVHDFHNFRVTAYVLQKVQTKSALIHDIIESAYNNSYKGWFEPFALSYHRMKLSTELGTKENEFLAEMTKIEREFGKKHSFTELWFNWREVKVNCLRSQSWFPVLNFESAKSKHRLWNNIQRQTLQFRRSFCFDSR